MVLIDRPPEAAVATMREVRTSQAPQAHLR
jgi:hypothetical protein